MTSTNVSVPGTATPYLIVSSDSHAGPSLKNALRPYCPAKYLDEFDDFAHMPSNARGAPGTRGRDWSKPRAVRFCSRHAPRPSAAQARPIRARDFVTWTPPASPPK